jgi:hypothetical protein
MGIASVRPGSHRNLVGQVGGVGQSVFMRFGPSHHRKKQVGHCRTNDAARDRKKQGMKLSQVSHRDQKVVGHGKPAWIFADPLVPPDPRFNRA